MDSCRLPLIHLILIRSGTDRNAGVPIPKHDLALNVFPPLSREGAFLGGVELQNQSLKRTVIVLDQLYHTCHQGSHLPETLFPPSLWGGSM